MKIENDASGRVVIQFGVKFIHTDKNCFIRSLEGVNSSTLKYINSKI